jgi:hypothetical protein
LLFARPPDLSAVRVIRTGFGANLVPRDGSRGIGGSKTGSLVNAGQKASPMNRKCNLVFINDLCLVD